MEPSILHGGMRLADLLVAAVVMLSFFPVRAVWDSDLALLGLVFAPVAAAWSNRHWWQPKPLDSGEEGAS